LVPTLRVGMQSGRSAARTGRQQKTSDLSWRTRNLRRASERDSGIFPNLSQKAARAAERPDGIPTRSVGTRREDFGCERSVQALQSSNAASSFNELVPIIR